MAELNDADKKAFIDKMIGTLKDPVIKARLIASQWDPTLRITALENGVTSVTLDEGLISQLEATLTAATATRRSDLDNNYALASSSVSSVEGTLGKDDPLVRDLRQYRSGLHQAPSGGTAAAVSSGS